MGINAREVLRTLHIGIRAIEKCFRPSSEEKGSDKVIENQRLMTTDTLLLAYLFSRGCGVLLSAWGVYYGIPYRRHLSIWWTYKVSF